MESSESEAAPRTGRSIATELREPGASTSGCFSPTSVQFKGEMNDALPRKRHQKRHLEFCTAYLRSRGSGVRVPPGAPFSLNPIQSKGVTEIILHPGFTPVICFFARWLGR